MYIGRKAALLEVLDALRGLHEQLEASDPRLAGVPLVTTSDQFLWQLYHLHNPGKLALDQGCHIFANVTTEDQRIGPENTVYEFQGGRVVMRVGGQRPCLLHFSGRAAGYSMAPWAGYLGLG
jgi:hypothetical protein